MKKVIRDTESESVEIKLVNDKKYYGWIYKYSYPPTNKKGFVSRDSNFAPKQESPMALYRARSLDSLTSGNGFDFQSQSLVDILEKLIKANFTVYEFEDRNEFLKFLMD